MSELELHADQEPHHQQGDRGAGGSRRRLAQRARRASAACRRRRGRRGPPPLPGLPGGGLLERPELSDELIDELLAGATTAQEIAGPDGLLRQLTRRLLERALEAEISEHLGYPAGHAPPGGAGNARNGRPAKTVLTDQGPVRIRAPRDRRGTFEPQIVGKRQTRWVGFDEKVIALYARGLTVREIQGHLVEIYGSEVSPDLISRITDAVLEDAKAWQNRPLDSVYAIVYLDALVGRSATATACATTPATSRSASTSTASARCSGSGSAQRGRQVLAAGPERAKQRGVADVLVACVDGLTGFPDAIEAVFPQTWVQTCIVHLVRASLRYVPYKDRRAVAADLRKIYTATDVDAAAESCSASPRNGTSASRRSAAAGSSTGNTSSPSSPFRPSCAARSTPPTRSRRSTARSERSSRPAGTSRPKTPPAS